MELGMKAEDRANYEAFDQSERLMLFFKLRRRLFQEEFQC